MNRFFLLLAFSLLVLTLPLSATGRGDGYIGGSQDAIPQIEAVNLEGGKLQLVATTSFIGDVLGEITGNYADIKTLMPRGQNPHSWEPGPSDIAALEEADLIFINGFGLEQNLLNIIRSMKTAPLIPVSVGVVPLGGGSKEGGRQGTAPPTDSQPGDGYPSDARQNDAHPGDVHATVEPSAANPHVWFSPLNVIVWVENMQSALSLADPAHDAEYRDAAASYINRLKALDEEIRLDISTLEPDQRKMVTDHSSFDYFARDYGFEISGKVISSSNDQAEPSARDIAALSNLVEKENIKAIFVGGTAGEELKKLAASVAAESGKNLPVVELLAGSLAPAGKRGDTYLDFVRYDTGLIVGALGSSK